MLGLHHKQIISSDLNQLTMDLYLACTPNKSVGIIHGITAGCIALSVFHSTDSDTDIMTENCDNSLDLFFAWTTQMTEAELSQLN